MKNPLSKNTLHIDGSFGEGGGQIIRTALSLSMITQTPIHITNIRAGRKKSGLMRQHLVCVKSAQAISHAAVTGAELGSGELTFVPHSIQSGNYRFEIGSAGSTSLVLQTILPTLLFAQEHSSVTITGGTHNPLAPTADFLSHAFFPALANLGIVVAYQLNKVGFAPIGGGEIVANISPVDLAKVQPLNLCESGELIGIELVAGELNLSHDILKRELATTKAKILAANDIVANKISTKTHSWHNIGEGNSCYAVVNTQTLTADKHLGVHQEVFTLLGEKGISAENIGKRLAGLVTRYLHGLKQGAYVDEYLTDQLLLPLALIAATDTGNGAKSSQFTARCISEHSRTQAMMIEKFLDVAITFEALVQDCHLVKITKLS